MHDNGNTGTGGDLVSTATSTINITAVNDAPVATITPASYSNTEQVALNLKNNGLSISDADAGSGSMTVTLAVTEGTLTVTTGTSGASVSGSGSSSVTITGTVAQVNALLNTNPGSTVSYVDNTDTPSATSTLTLTVHDNGNTGTGGDLVSTATSTINITAVNDAPVATITPASYSNTEQVALNLKNNGLSISDADAGSGSMTVTLAVTEGTLSVTAGTSGATVTNSGSSSVTITGTVAQVNALLNSNATSTVSYVDSTDTPSATSTLHFDGARQRQHRHRRRSGLGRRLSTINITAVNDAPVATITPASYSNTEQVSLNLKSNGLSISDVDAGSGSHDGHPGRDRGHADRHDRYQRCRRHQLRHLVGDDHRHGGAGQRAAELQCDLDALLRRQHRYAVGHLDVYPDGARQRQHRHRWRSGLNGHLDDQHHGGERRSRRDDHAGELLQHRAGCAQPQEQRPVDLRRRRRLGLHDGDARRDRGHTDRHHRHQRCHGHQLRHARR